MGEHPINIFFFLQTHHSITPIFHYSSFLPPVMGEGLIRLSHFVSVLFLLNGSPSVIGCIDQFS
jgi:hypothetical protein